LKISQARPLMLHRPHTCTDKHGSAITENTPYSVS